MRQGWETRHWAAPGAPLTRRSRPTPARSSVASPSTRSWGWRSLAGTLQDPVQTLQPSAEDRGGRAGPGSLRSQARCCCPASSRCRRRRCGGATLSRHLQPVRGRRRAEPVERCGQDGRPGHPPRGGDAVRVARGRAAVRQQAACWWGFARGFRTLSAIVRQAWHHSDLCSPGGPRTHAWVHDRLIGPSALNYDLGGFHSFLDWLGGILSLGSMASAVVTTVQRARRTLMRNVRFDVRLQCNPYILGRRTQLQALLLGLLWQCRAGWGGVPGLWRRGMATRSLYIRRGLHEGLSQESWRRA